jgi:hypothetical protein
MNIVAEHASHRPRRDIMLRPLLAALSIVGTLGAATPAFADWYYPAPTYQYVTPPAPYYARRWHDRDDWRWRDRDDWRWRRHEWREQRWREHEWREHHRRWDWD